MPDTAEAIRLTVAQAAKRLGVTPKTMAAYDTAGVIVAFAPNGRGPGKRIYFDPDEVMAYHRGGATGAAAYRRRRDGL